MRCQGKPSPKQQSLGGFDPSLSARGAGARKRGVLSSAYMPTDEARPSFQNSEAAGSESARAFVRCSSVPLHMPATAPCFHGKGRRTKATSRALHTEAYATCIYHRHGMDPTEYSRSDFGRVMMMESTDKFAYSNECIY